MSDPLAPTADTELRAHLERILDGLYDLDSELGRGGMGIVFKARDRKLKRTVAIKVLPPELGFRAEIRTRFLREAETAAQLTHPNIVPIYSVDEREGLVYFVMAFVDGDNLAKRIHDRGAMDPAPARKLLRDVADALAYAHSRKVIHRDIKPDNILLDAASGRPMVTDFGIARAISDGADARLTATGMAIGTPAYMSPEQSAGDREVDGRSDLYSLGVVAYQMLSGELPFIASSTPAMLVKHLQEQPMPINMRRAGIPADLAAAVMCLLEKDPANRFDSAAALVAVLDGGGNIPQARAVAPRPPHAWSPMPAAQPPSPTPEEFARWNAPVVVAFRRKIKPYIVVNAVILAFAIFTRTNMLPISAIWGVVLAFKYSKVWSAGYDWRDVFEQPRDRMFFDVLGEWIDDVRSLFDREKRAEVRARWQARRRPPSPMTPPPASSALAPVSRPQTVSARDLVAISGPRGSVARQALLDRDVILQLVATLPERERKEVGDIGQSVQAMAERIKGLSTALAELDRNPLAHGAVTLDREITLLESQANPLDHAASEARVRRLALLKRDRRGVADRDRRREELEAKLDSCALAMKNLRLDVLHLKTGTSSTQSVTQLAQHAMALARDVDGMIAGHTQLASPARPESRP